MVFTNAELIKISEWIKKNYSNGKFYFSFAQGFEGRYVIIETIKDCREGRRVYNLNEILIGDED